MSAPSKIVCVIGATGAQGIPVVRALTKDGKYAVRAVTRDATGPDAKMLASWPNVTLCVGNVYDEKFLRQAFKGTQLAFVNTNGYVTGEKGEIYWGKYETSRRHGDSMLADVLGSADWITRHADLRDCRTEWDRTLCLGCSGLCYQERWLRREVPLRAFRR